MSFSIRLTDTEKALAEEAYAEYLKDGKQAKPIEELWKELDLE